MLSERLGCVRVSCRWRVLERLHRRGSLSSGRSAGSACAEAEDYLDEEARETEHMSDEELLDRNAANMADAYVLRDTG